MIHQIENSPMKMAQYLTIFVCFLMNCLDGMDVMIITYTAPAIAGDWNISPANLGIVFSSGLIGMTVGAVLIAPYADYIGRKKIMMLAALLMASCIYITTLTHTINELIAVRFISGLGIGAMLASTTALTAEYTQAKYRDFFVNCVIAGYPVGAVLSGFASARIIREEGWRSMYETAGIITLLAIPIIYFLLDESLDYLLNNQPKNALEKANKILVKLGVKEMNHLPEVEQEKRVPIKLATLLNEDYKPNTIKLWTSLFLAFSTLYFLTNWIPKLVVNAGVSEENAIYAGTIFNLGAIFGIPLQALLSRKIGLNRSIGSILIATSVMMVLFKLFFGSDWVLVAYFLLGFGIQGGFVGLYAVAARLYPTRIRATGVGWAIGMGRLGGILGPILGGILITIGLSMVESFWAFAIPTFAAGFSTLKIKL